MNLRPSNNNSPTAHDANIDAALRAYGGAAPAPGIESRIAARIAATPPPSYRSASSVFSRNRWLVLWRGVSAGALAAAAACAVVVGTVHHSQHIAVPTATGPSRSQGVSAAGGTHLPTRAVSPSATIDPQAPRSAPHSRASISRNAGSKPTGSAVPRSPYPPDQSAPDPQQ